MSVAPIIPEGGRARDIALQGAANGMELAIQVVKQDIKAFFHRLIALDREGCCDNYGVTPDAQLKGRDYQIKLGTVQAIGLALLALGIVICSGVYGGKVGLTITACVAGAMALYCGKEAIAHKRSRAIQQAHMFTEESEETRYGWGEFFEKMLRPI